MKNKDYAWVVLIALTLMYAGSNGYGYLSIPAFYPTLTEVFGLPKGVVPQAASIITLIVALLSPFIGYLLDRYNPRAIVTGGAVGLVVMMYFFTQIQTFDQLKLFNTGFAVALCFGGIITSQYIINKWFTKNRGIALGIFLNASSLGAAFFNPYIGKLLKSGLGWQEVSTKSFTIAACLLLIPVLFVRVRPKELDDNSTESKQLLNGPSLKEIARTPSFWLLMMVTGGLWFCINGLIFHKDSYLTDLKLDPAQIGKFGGMYFLCGVLGKLIFGFLSDKFNKKNIMILSIGCIFLGSILLKLSLTDPSILPYVAIIYGIGYSGSFTMIQLLIAEFYMGKSYGTILGIFIMVDTLFGTLGIYLLGTFRQTTGDYGTSFLTMIGICIFSFIATFLVQKPKAATVAES
jgi:MFS transporter, OFA family, oxalate/formate antiporter